jgi:hypothetical protein
LLHLTFQHHCAINASVDDKNRSWQKEKPTLHDVNLDHRRSSKAPATTRKPIATIPLKKF